MSNTITAYFKGRVGVAESVYQNDYGIVMAFDSIELPAHFDCYFTVSGSDTSIPGVGADNRVVIPNTVLSTSGKVEVHIPLHTGENDSEVEYVAYFKVIGRARPEDDGTPTQMTAIERALALLSQPITNIEEIVNEALAFTGETFEEMQEDLDEWKTGVEGGLNTWKGGVEADFDTLQAQFDTALGAVTTDTEVTNIRVGADGVTDTTAGASVRRQFEAAHRSLEVLNESDVIFNRVFSNTGTAKGAWIWGAINPKYDEFDFILRKVVNVSSPTDYVRIQFSYTDSTESNVYISDIGSIYHVVSNKEKTINTINLYFWRADAVVGESVTSSWEAVAYVGNNIAANAEAINASNKEIDLLNMMNNTTILLNKRYRKRGGEATFWDTNAITVRQTPFYAMITEADGIDVGVSEYAAIVVGYTDSTSQNFYLTQLNTPVLVTPNTEKTVSAISVVLRRASSSTTIRWSTWSIIAYAGNTIGNTAADLDVLEETSAIVAKSVGKYERIFQELSHIGISDDGTSTWYSGITLGHGVMKTDERGIIININRTNVVARVYIWENEPTAGVRYNKLFGYDGVWERAYIAPNTYFAVFFRTPSQSASPTVETVQNNCRIMWCDEYVGAYMDNGIKAFDEKITTEMDDYPLMFGVITDAHYPTGNTEYEYQFQRGYIKHGCDALKTMASNTNCLFIANLGDDAGYSPADNNEANIIKSMTTVDGMLRGKVRVLPVNGNHEAFQNHPYMDSTDFYRARMVNLDGVTKVSNVATNYYFDDDFFKVRFVFFDVETYQRNDYSDEIAWEQLQSMFASAPSDYKFILFCHKDIGEDTSFPQYTNFHGAITEYIPRLLFQCSGHTHKDGYYEANGVRDISFIAAGCFNYKDLTETTQWAMSEKEASFAIVGVNPTTMQVKVYGYGMASDRTFDFSE